MSDSHDDTGSRRRPEHLHLVSGGPGKDERELGRRRLRQLNRWLTVAMVAGLAVAIGWVVVGLYRFGVPGPETTWSAWLFYWHGLRAALLVAVVVFWPRLIGQLCSWLRASPAFRQALIGWRWRAALLIVLIELVVIHAVPVVFVQRLLGGI